MKKAGIVGGIGPASTVEYCNYIIEGWRAANDDDSYPSFTVENVDMTAMLGHLERKDFAALAVMLLSAVISLKNAGADFAAIASNTPHVVYEHLSSLTPIPILSIVDCAVKRAAVLGLKKVLLLGTRYTMTADFYSVAFERAGISCVSPSPSDVEEVHYIIFPKLEAGIVVPADKQRLVGLIEKYAAEENIDGVVLGCTELPLMIRPDDVSIPVVDTTLVHAKAIVAEMLKA